MVRRAAKETLDGLLDANADRMCQSKRYQRMPNGADPQAGQLRPQAAFSHRRRDGRGSAATGETRLRGYGGLATACYPETNPVQIAITPA